MITTALFIWLAGSPRDPVSSRSADETALAPRMSSSACDVWLSTPADVPFSAISERVADLLTGRSPFVLHEWTAGNQPRESQPWIRVAETRGQWQIAYRGSEGKVELEALTVLHPTTLEADIAGEVALIALSSCSSALQRVGAGPSEPAPMGVIRPGVQPSQLRPSPLVGATVAMGTLGLLGSAIGFGLSFHYYRDFKGRVDDCIFTIDSTSSEDVEFSDMVEYCRGKYQTSMRMHWFTAGVGTVGALMLGTGLVLAIPATIQFRRRTTRTTGLRVLAWGGTQGAGLGLRGHF